MKELSFYDLSNTCIKIVKKNTPEKSIDKISVLINPKTEKKVGKVMALKVYKSLVSYTVPYNKKLYENNYTLYNCKINANIQRAENYIS